MAQRVRLTLDEIKDRMATLDRAKLDATTDADIARHMREDGFDPDAPIPDTARAVPAPRTVRELYGMTQDAFARFIGVPLPTWRNWEQGRKLPDPAARALLTILAREPEAARRAFGSAA